MNIFILAAGLGTRLKPLTDTMPKALVPIAGKPLLQHQIEKFCELFEDLHIVINVHHFADMIAQFLKENNNFGIDIRISDESDMLLETGGGLRKALPLFPNDDPVLIHNVDILSNIDLVSFSSQASKHSDAAAVLLVSDIEEDTSRYLITDDENNLIGWTNTQTGEVKGPVLNIESRDKRRETRVNFTGIHIVNPSIIRPLLERWNGKFSIIDFYLDACARVPVHCHMHPRLDMVDVGKLSTLHAAEEFIN